MCTTMCIMMGMTVNAEFAQDIENPDSLGMAAGRKPKPAHLRRTERVAILLTKSDLRILKDAAKRAGKDLGVWIRRQALAAAGVPNPE